MTTPIDSSSDSKSLILKTDTRDRVLTPPERREALLDEFERSGLSGAKYAAMVGIKYQTFATWAQRRRQQRGTKSPVPVKSKTEQARWLEAVVEQAQGLGDSSGLMLQLPGGVRVQITSNQHIGLAAALVRALDKPC